MKDKSIVAAERSRSPRTVLIMMSCGLLGGAATGWIGGKLVKAAIVRGLPWSDEAALVIAMVFLFAGLLTAVLAASRWGRAFLADPSAPAFDRAPPPIQAALFWPQAGVLVLAGGLLIAPVAHDIASKAEPIGFGSPLVIGILVAFMFQTALNGLIWMRGDEVMRKTIAESGAVCFWLLQGVLFLWAAGEKLNMLPSISAWDVVTVLMGVYLITSSIVAYRVGLT